MKRRSNIGMYIAVCLGTAFIIFMGVPGAEAQDMLSDGFIGQGVAAIADGNIVFARKNALADAQRKVVMEAVSGQISVEEMAKYFLTLTNVFFKHPGIYLQRFKVVKENALFDTYQVIIHGFVQQDLLRHDLEAMGIVGPEYDKLKVLVMIAESDADEPEKSFYWWSSDEGAKYSRYQLQKTMEKKLQERGAHIVNPFETPVNVLSEEVRQSPEPDVNTVSNFASHLNARLVVLGRGRLSRTAEQKLSSLTSIQCNLNTRVIDVRRGSVAVQAATYALGLHIDEESAVADAIEKACERIAGQIMDKIYLQMKQLHEFIFKLSFDTGASETDIHTWFDVFQNRFPELELLEITKKEESNLWLVKLNSTIEGAALLQKMFETRIGGYIPELESLNENIIKLKLIPSEEGYGN